jgi:hypothetical protein
MLYLLVLRNLQLRADLLRVSKALVCSTPPVNTVPVHLWIPVQHIAARMSNRSGPSPLRPDCATSSRSTHRQGSSVQGYRDAFPPTDSCFKWRSPG